MPFNYETIGAVLAGAVAGTGVTWAVLRWIIDGALTRFELRKDKEIEDKFVPRELCVALRGNPGNCSGGEYESR